ncbi:MAG TPA: dephospho-CoA kinase [Thermoanaerobaculia bacterium]
MSARRRPGPYLVGLTGGLASGKSTVAELLAEHGCLVIDADDVVAWLYESGRPGARAVRDLFGPEVLDTAGSVDRGRLARLVFADPEARRRLEAAIHPLVRERFYDLAATGATEGAKIVVLEATLLVEAGFADDFDLVVTVEAPEAVRRERAVARGLSEEQAQARLDAQGPGDARRAAADVVIDNSGDLAALERRVDELAADLARRAAGEDGDRR